MICMLVNRVNLFTQIYLPCTIALKPPSCMSIFRICEQQHQLPMIVVYLITKCSNLCMHYLITIGQRFLVNNTFI